MNSLVSTTSRSFRLNSSAIWAKAWNLYTVGAKMISRLSAIRLAEKASIAMFVLLYLSVLFPLNGAPDGGHDVGGPQAVFVH